MLYRWP